MKELKYDKEFYETCEYFDGDMDSEIVDETYKLVKCRKEHKCFGSGKNCEKKIIPGDYAVRNQGIIPGEGWASVYVCIPCVEQWLEESGQVVKEGDDAM